MKSSKKKINLPLIINMKLQDFFIVQLNNKIFFYLLDVRVFG